MSFIKLFWNFFRAVITSMMSIGANNKHHKLVESIQISDFQCFDFISFVIDHPNSLWPANTKTTSKLEDDALNLDS